MPILAPMPLDTDQCLAAISPRSLAEHYRLYQGYVLRYNELGARLDALKARETDFSVSEVESIKVDLTFALGAVKNHELYFGALGANPQPPAGELARAIDAHFGSLGKYLQDLKQTATTARGWAWTVFDLDYGHLFNYPGSGQNAMPVPNVLPLLAIDLYGHAYFYDFGNNKNAYLDALIDDIAWEKIALRFQRAQGLRTRV